MCSTDLPPTIICELLVMNGSINCISLKRHSLSLSHDFQNDHPENLVGFVDTTFSGKKYAESDWIMQ